MHGLTHRAAEKAAGLPPGTASNYFRSREALLVATAERVAELHLADMDRVSQSYYSATNRTESAPEDVAGQVTDLLTASLLEAATTFRGRYLAVFELQLEAVRRPVLASALAGLLDNSAQFTAGHHAQLGLPIPRERIPTLITLYAGTLFTLVAAPPETISEEGVRGVVRAIVHGTLPELKAR